LSTAAASVASFAKLVGGSISNPQILAVGLRHLWNRIHQDRLIRSDAQRILHRSARPGRVLFVDGGANLGQAFSAFSRHFPTDTVAFELFEPNPHCRAALETVLSAHDGRAVRLHEAALSVRDGETLLYGLSGDEGGPLSQGASIVRHQHDIFYDADPATAIAVPTVDFCEYLKRQSAAYGTIVVKLDVEGAEIDILEGLIGRDCLRLIDTLYVEFHSHFLSASKRPTERQREQRIRTALAASGVHVRIWH